MSPRELSAPKGANNEPRSAESGRLRLAGERAHVSACACAASPPQLSEYEQDRARRIAEINADPRCAAALGAAAQLRAAPAAAEARGGDDQQAGRRQRAPQAQRRQQSQQWKQGQQSQQWHSRGSRGSRGSSGSSGSGGSGGSRHSSFQATVLSLDRTVPSKPTCPPRNCKVN